MKLGRHTFARRGEDWIEISDFRARWPDQEPERTGTMFAVFFPDLSASTLRGRLIDCRYVDVYDSVKPSGAWLTGGHWWLELALKHMGLPVAY